MLESNERLCRNHLAEPASDCRKRSMRPLSRLMAHLLFSPVPSIARCLPSPVPAQPGVATHITPATGKIFFDIVPALRVVPAPRLPAVAIRRLIIIEFLSRAVVRPGL